MTREAQSNTLLTEDTWSSGVAREQANVTHTPVASTSFVHWITGVTENSGSSSSVPFIAIDDVLGFDACELVNTADYSQALVSIGQTYGGSPAGSEKFSFYLQGSTAGAIKSKHHHVLTLELDDADQHAASTSTSTTTSSTFQDKVTKTFTPATEGDYLIIAEAHVKHGSAASDVEVQLTLDGTVYNLMSHRPTSTSEWHPWVCVLGAIDGETAGALSAASHTIKIQYRSVNGSTTAEIRNARITILRLDTFANFYYEENSSRSRQTTNSTTYVTKLTNAPTIANAGNHLIFASAHIDGTVARGPFGQIVKGITSPTTLLESRYVPTRSLGNDDASLAMFRMENLSAGASDANSWTIDLKKASVGLGGAGCEHNTICVIELAEPVSGRYVSIGQSGHRTQVAYGG